MFHVERWLAMPSGGARPGSGPKKKERPPVPETKRESEILLEVLNRPAQPTDSYEVQQWRKLTEAKDLNIRGTYRWKLFEHARGRAIHTVNHLHDKPIQVEHTLLLAEEIREARQRSSRK